MKTVLVPAPGVEDDRLAKLLSELVRRNFIKSCLRLEDGEYLLDLKPGADRLLRPSLWPVGTLFCGGSYGALALHYGLPSGGGRKKSRSPTRIPPAVASCREGDSHGTYFRITRARWRLSAIVGSTSEFRG